jgi:telomerase reverse transcriptase
MLDLLLDCAIFRQITAGRDNYQQLSGVPVSDLEYQSSPVPAAVLEPSHTGGKAGKIIPRSASEISVVRSRMLYARAALNARGLVHFGLRHIRKLGGWSIGPKSS